MEPGADFRPTAQAAMPVTPAQAAMPVTPAQAGISATVGVGPVIAARHPRAGGDLSKLARHSRRRGNDGERDGDPD
jgi:hypothetical protein